MAQSTSTTTGAAQNMKGGYNDFWASMAQDEKTIAAAALAANKERMVLLGKRQKEYQASCNRAAGNSAEIKALFEKVHDFDWEMVGVEEEEWEVVEKTEADERNEEWSTSGERMKSLSKGLQ